MTEKDKMLNGLKYDSSDLELVKDRMEVRKKCQQLNNLDPYQLEEKKKLIKEIFGKTGDEISITAPFWCDYGYNITIGDRFYANFNLVILDCAKVEFGDDVLIGPNCGFYTASHPIDPQERKTGIEDAKKIVVGNNVWFGAGVHVLPGVTIGNDVVVAAGSVVNKDVPDRVLVAGNPAKIIKKI